MGEPPGAQALLRAAHCAERLRSAILAGDFLPGERLDELALAVHLGVSRNTLREAFRLLGADELVVHEPHRGVFVRTVDADSSRAIYDVRRQLEVGALDELAGRPGGALTPVAEAALEAMGRAVTQAERAREGDDWQAVGTANAHFHLAVVDLAGNPVASRFMHVLTSLTRLRLLTLGDPRGVHEGFVDENRRIWELVGARQHARARAVLELYLLRARDEFS